MNNKKKRYFFGKRRGGCPLIRACSLIRSNTVCLAFLVENSQILSSRRCTLQESPDTSLDSPTDSDCFALPPGVLDADAALPPTVAPVGVPVRRPDDFRSPPLCPPAPLPSQRSGGGGVPIVSAQTIKSIASSIQNLPPVVGGGGAGRGGVERSLSRSSYSPAMSDSGISVDAGSSGSGSNQSLANLAALAKLGAVNVNGHGALLEGSHESSQTCRISSRFFFFRLLPLGVATADSSSPCCSLLYAVLRHIHCRHILSHHIHQPPFRPPPFPLSWQLYRQHPSRA